uniref:Uncharacterized protein n=1 Tax=Spongospora subterranea TaxID=70186 RepID=A0A0H5R2I6_9EUKA|eukprot:CRZ02094.1 hypothetical protein [Spongospora subterranea]
MSDDNSNNSSAETTISETDSAAGRHDVDSSSDIATYSFTSEAKESLSPKIVDCSPDFSSIETGLEHSSVISEENDEMQQSLKTTTGTSSGQPRRPTGRGDSESLSLKEIRNLLARFELQKHTITQDSVNEKLPSVRQQYSQGYEQRRQARNQLRESLHRLNSILDQNIPTNLNEGAAMVRKTPEGKADPKIMQEVQDRIDALAPGESWKEDKYKLDHEYKW